MLNAYPEDSVDEGPGGDLGEYAQYLQYSVAALMSGVLPEYLTSLCLSSACWWRWSDFTAFIVTLVLTLRCDRQTFNGLL